MMDIPTRIAEINEELKALYAEAAELSEQWMLGIKDSSTPIPDNVVIGPWKGDFDVHNRSEK